jgi:hypothetical protein
MEEVVIDTNNPEPVTVKVRYKYPSVPNSQAD